VRSFYAGKQIRELPRRGRCRGRRERRALSPRELLFKAGRTPIVFIPHRGMLVEKAGKGESGSNTREEVGAKKGMCIPSQGYRSCSSEKAKGEGPAKKGP